MGHLIHHEYAVGDLIFRPVVRNVSLKYLFSVTRRDDLHNYPKSPKSQKRSKKSHEISPPNTEDLIYSNPHRLVSQTSQQNIFKNP